MTSRQLPKCYECGKTESFLWRSVEENGQICQDCFEKRTKLSTDALIEGSFGEVANTKEYKFKDKENHDAGGPSIEKKSSTCDEKRLRKSTRATRFKNKAASTTSNTTSGNQGNGGGNVGGHATNATSNKSQVKGRNRRNLFKRTPLKTPTAQTTTHIVDNVFHKGSYLQVGDIVSLVDSDHNVYYAQIRGLLVDNYCEKSAFLTWLIPTQASPNPKEGFDAATYLIGPDEDLSRRLSCLEFVMHAPSNYYLDRTTPFPLPDSMELESRPGGYVWTTLPEIQRKKSAS